MSRATLPMVLSFAAIGYYFIAPKYADQLWDWRDYASITGVILLIWWLVRSRRNTLIDADGHEQARQGFAFRLGKHLNRVRSRFRR